MLIFRHSDRQKYLTRHKFLFHLEMDRVKKNVDTSYKNSLKDEHKILNNFNKFYLNFKLFYLLYQLFI